MAIGVLIPGLVWLGLAAWWFVGALRLRRVQR